MAKAQLVEIEYEGANAPATERFVTGRIQFVEHKEPSTLWKRTAIIYDEQGRYVNYYRNADLIRKITYVGN